MSKKVEQAPVENTGASIENEVAQATETIVEQATVENTGASIENEVAQATETIAEQATVKNTDVAKEVVAANIYKAEDGTEIEFAVKHFNFNGVKYNTEEAPSDILEVLYQSKSSIFKF